MAFRSYLKLQNNTVYKSNMKKYRYFILLPFFSSYAFADKSIEVNVIRSVHEDVQAQYVITFSNTQAEFGKSVWRSTNGIECFVSLVPQLKGLPKGQFECITPEKYKAQIGFDCKNNNTKNNSAYMFFGQTGNFDTIGNFYVWCN